MGVQLDDWPWQWPQCDWRRRQVAARFARRRGNGQREGVLPSRKIV